MTTPGAEPIPNPTLGRSREPAVALHSTTARVAYALVSGLFAALLLVAAGLKADVVLNNPFRSSPGSGSGMQLLSVFTETAVAVWLLSGVQRRWARRAAIALLSVFVAVAGWHFLRGDDDCGCFGRVRVRPVWTLVIDAAALASIWYFGRWTSVAPVGGTRARAARPHGVRIFLALAAGLCVPAFTALLAADPYKLQSDAVDGGGSDPVLLDPRDWGGKPFPLLDDVLPSDQDLAKGRWVVILVNHACHKCEAYLSHADFDALRRVDGPGAPPRMLGLIEFLNDESEPKKLTGPVPVTTLRLRKGATYLTDGPYEIYLSDGIVERAQRALPPRGG